MCYNYIKLRREYNEMIDLGFYERVVAILREQLGEERVKTGEFGADMKVALVNDGPVSIELLA